MPTTADITKLGYRFSTGIKTILVIKACSTRTSALMMPRRGSPVVPNGNVVDKRGQLIDGRRRRPPVPATPHYDLLKPRPRGLGAALLRRCASSLIRWSLIGADPGRGAPRGPAVVQRRHPALGRIKRFCGFFPRSRRTR